MRAALLAGALAACGPQPAPPGDGLLLLAERSFAGSTRVAERLDDILGATDVLGPAHARALSAPRASWPALVGEAEDLRAVIAIVGDLSLLRGVDPSILHREPGPLTSRDVDEAALDALLDELQGAADARDVPLLLATAPLGLQGRIELPELGQVAERLRARGAALDLAAGFQEREEAELFSNGIDLLDPWGHDELARQLVARLAGREGALPPRDRAEREARVEAFALGELVAGRAEAAFDAAEALSVADAPTPRHAARRMALRSAREGIVEPAVIAGWTSIADAEGDVPALAAGLRLCRLPPNEALAPGDPVERELLALLDAIASEADDARARAEALVDAFPWRIEAWIGLQLVALVTEPVVIVRHEACRAMRHTPRISLTPSDAAVLLDGWPATISALPALLAAQRAEAHALPTGPAFDRARRRARLGYVPHVRELLPAELAGDRWPPAWRAWYEALPEG